MTVERALGELRREPHVLGVPTGERDVFWMRSGDPMLSLAPGLAVWGVPSGSGGSVRGPCRWRCHTVDDSAGAAGLIHRIHEHPREEPPGGGAAPR